MNPAVSVLIPAFQAENTIRQAVWSVLNQSFVNFELIIWLDGCSDRTDEIVSSFEDNRIRIFRSAENRGIVFTRNALIAESRAPFIAWLDADDLMLPGRLAYQHDFLQVHPEIAVLGSWVAVRNSKVTQVRWPAKADVLAAWMFYRNPFVQSSLMIRKQMLVGLYNSEFEYLEDYEMLLRIAQEHRVGVFQKALCSYLEDSEQARIDKYLKYNFVGKLEKLMLRNFHNLGLSPGSDDLALIREFLRHNHKLKVEHGKRVLDFLHAAVNENAKRRVYPVGAFRAVSAWQFIRLAKACRPLRLRIGIYFLFKPLLFINASMARPRYFV